MNYGKSVLTILLMGSSIVGFAQKEEAKLADKKDEVYRVKYYEEGEEPKKNDAVNDLHEIYAEKYMEGDTLSKMSYAFGQSIARNFEVQGFEAIDLAAMNLAILDVMTNKETKMTDTEAQEILSEYMNKMMELKAAKAKAKGEAFLAENGKRKEVTTTSSGLQYEVIKKAEGEGTSPTPNNKVTVHYHGTLTDGTVFDSSVDRGKPATFGLKQVIPGWTEGLQLMKVGDKYRFWLPSDLAYGERGAPGGKIGPNEVLVFEVELIEVK